MTIFNIAGYSEASYENIPFYYQNSTIDGGRKTITHEFPDSNTRYVEDLGLLEKVFNIEAIIDTNKASNNLDRFITALDKEGLGILIHPVLGTKQVVVKNYALSHSINENGIIRISIVFEKAEQNKFPEQDKGNIGKVGRLKGFINSLADSSIIDKWDSVKQNVEKLNSANQSLKDTARDIKRISSLVEGSANGITEFITSINVVIDEAGGLVQSPFNLAKKLRTSFDNLEIAYNSAQDIFDVSKNFSGFNVASNNTPSGTSSTSKGIKANQSLLNNYVQASGLGISYEQAANITYTNLEQLNNIRETLEKAFLALPSDIERSLYKAILNVRVETNILFDKLSINLARVVNSSTNPTSLNMLTYSIYGSLDNKDILKDLNNIKDTSEVSGNIKILSNG